jgi:hypothetical protein
LSCITAGKTENSGGMIHYFGVFWVMEYRWAAKLVKPVGQVG